ncbi:MAG: bi-domain-containing oxidoreductase [Thermoguttaceae bacterium]|jgi:predicted dehydrogenase
MKQLTQKLSDGRPAVHETPVPTLEPGQILVQNFYSVVSSGTEGATVRSARKNIVAKAMDRPKDVQAVLELFRRQGVVQTYRAVMKKLDAYSPMGYTSAGKAIAVGSNVRGFAVGDLVACAGVGYASHAEVVAVPENLCVKLHPDADLRAAAYNAIGAIALQGTRQADLRLGETCVVIGLGLVGMLVCQLLNASGVATLGIDVAPKAVEKARALGFNATLRSAHDLEERVEAMTRGLGVDAVIIAAVTSSRDPINLAGKLSRSKGRVVVLGDVPTGFDRGPDYYPKELELRMSRSYGPGRYDLNYEEKGVDYPADYVRWTENRNMQAFQDLAHSGRIDVNALTTHTFSLDDAHKAYDMILERSEYFLGVLIEYDVARDANKKATREPIVVATRQENRRDVRERVGYAFIGAGSYAQGSLLPNLPRNSSYEPIAVMTRAGATARRVAEKFGFRECVSRSEDVMANPEVDAVFIATRHNLHTPYVLEALRHNKSVFVEKPLCLTLEEYVDIRKKYESKGPSAPKLMVGFNRRFAPLAVELKSRLASNAPIATIYRVNAGAIPAGSWIQDPEIGGGRILGEVCHFVDFAAWLADSTPSSVYAAAIRDPNSFNDTLSIQLKLENGSIATICYFANGAKAVAKERVEVFQAGQTGILDDFRTLRFVPGSGRRFVKKTVQNKGQAAELKAFLNAVKKDEPAPIAPEEIFSSTLATFAILESLKTGKEIPLTSFE